ncbi:MAG: arginine--tRNA ligase [Clostridia bacterium]|nr:arginine--tRNA ligase [Clostridia bacterium]
MDFKKHIVQKIKNAIEIEEDIEKYIEIPPDSSMGDYAFPCFSLAKVLRKAPPVIAGELKDKIETDDIIKDVQIKGGYLNFYINKNLLSKEVLTGIVNNKEYGKSNIGEGKTVLIDYSAPNIAKPFHIGHLRTTLIGNALYKVYKYLGYNTVGINHLGDYGTQFGKMIEGYKLWGNEYNLEEDPINKMMDMYVRINNLCKEDEEVLERARENFRLLEAGDPYCTELWNRFKDLSLKEFYKIYNILDVEFDSLNGEAFYADKTDEVVEILKKKGKLTESEGAMIVDLEDVGISTPCIIKKANGSTIYATRDLAAILYRARTYDFDKCLYVVAYEQNLHFKQIFEVAKYLVDEKYAKGLIHVSYGMVALPTGKMSTRLGNVVKIEDLINETIGKAKEIISEKNPDLENKDEVAKKVGLAAIIFNTLSTTANKDQIFDWNTALNFQGETGPYIQYTYVRTKSVLEKIDELPNPENIDYSVLSDIHSENVLKLVYSFDDVLVQVTEKNEPAILARYLIDLAKAYSGFYNENKIIGEEKKVQDARVLLTLCVNKVLEIGAGLMGIKMPDKM